MIVNRKGEKIRLLYEIIFAWICKVNVSLVEGVSNIISSNVCRGPFNGISFICRLSTLVKGFFWFFQSFSY